MMTPVAPGVTERINRGRRGVLPTRCGPEQGHHGLLSLLSSCYQSSANRRPSRTFSFRLATPVYEVWPAEAGLWCSPLCLIPGPRRWPPRPQARRSGPLSRVQLPSLVWAFSDPFLRQRAWGVLDRPGLHRATPQTRWETLSPEDGCWAGVHNRCPRRCQHPSCFQSHQPKWTGGCGCLGGGRHSAHLDPKSTGHLRVCAGG